MHVNTPFPLFSYQYQIVNNILSYQNMLKRKKKEEIVFVKYNI